MIFVISLKKEDRVEDEDDDDDGDHEDHSSRF